MDLAVNLLRLELERKRNVERDQGRPRVISEMSRKQTSSIHDGRDPGMLTKGRLFFVLNFFRNAFVTRAVQSSPVASAVGLSIMAAVTLRQVTRLSLTSARSAQVRRYATSTKDETDPQLNGYPQLPFVSRQHLPAQGWQDPLLRRNFGDTVSIHSVVSAP